MIDRRTFIATSAIVILGAPLVVEAQREGKVPRIGVLLTGPPPRENAPTPTIIDAFRQGLREHGYVEGQNVAIEWRWAGERPDQLPDLATELVRLRVDLIVANINPAIQAAQRATRTIPIVMMLSVDPVGLGFVAGLARPGGNITGMTTQAPELAEKRLELLKEAASGLFRVAILWDPSEPSLRPDVSAAEAAAAAFGVRRQLVEARSASELDRAFAAMIKDRADAVYLQGNSVQFIHRAQLAERAVKSRLPMVCPSRLFAEAGCLMSYGVSFTDIWRRAGYFVDKILRGAKPADLPVEQPTKFEFVINLKTAKALGLTIQPSVLGRADEIIE